MGSCSPKLFFMYIYSKPPCTTYRFNIACCSFSIAFLPLGYLLNIMTLYMSKKWGLCMLATCMSLMIQGRCILLKYFLLICVRILSVSACLERCLCINAQSGIIFSSTWGISKSVTSGLLKTCSIASSLKGTSI